MHTVIPEIREPCTCCQGKSCSCQPSDSTHLGLSIRKDHLNEWRQVERDYLNHCNIYRADLNH
jgi:hypothetical protein